MYLCPAVSLLFCQKVHFLFVPKKKWHALFCSLFVNFTRQTQEQLALARELYTQMRKKRNPSSTLARSAQGRGKKGSITFFLFLDDVTYGWLLLSFPLTNDVFFCSTKNHLVIVSQRGNERRLHLCRCLIAHEVHVGGGDVREASLGQIVAELDTGGEAGAADGDRDRREGVRGER